MGSQLNQSESMSRSGAFVGRLYGSSIFFVGLFPHSRSLVWSQFILDVSFGGLFSGRRERARQREREREREGDKER